MNFRNNTLALVALVLISGGFVQGSYALAASTPSRAQWVKLNPQLHVTDIEWKRMQALKGPGLAQTWTKHTTKGIKLANWHWTWRLAWLQACAQSNEAICTQIYAAGLKDKALIVRSKTVQILGRRYRDRGDKALLTILSKSFADKRNYRHGRPLRIQKDILFALKQIGTSDAKKLAFKLADGHDDLSEYVEKINRQVVY